MNARHKLDRIWKGAIEDGTNIIVAHGPPKGVLDLSEDMRGNLEFCGCKSLMNRVMEVKPTLVLFGHIHNSRTITTNSGMKKIAGLDTIFSNAATVTDGKMGEITSNGNVIEI